MQPNWGTFDNTNVGESKKPLPIIGDPHRVEFPAKNAASNKLYIAVLVPSTRNTPHGQKQISESHFHKRIAAVADFFDQAFHGATNLGGYGSWKDASGKTVGEYVAKVECFTTAADYAKYDRTLQQFLRKKKQDWSQKSIGYIYKEKMYFV